MSSARWNVRGVGRVMGVALSLAVIAAVLAADEVKILPPDEVKILPAEILGLEEKAAADAKKLRDDAAAFGREGASMPAERAAERWLALLDRALALGDEVKDQPWIADQHIEPVMNALPPPAAWPHVARLVDARPRPKTPRNAVIRDHGLRLMAYALAGSEAAFKEETAKLEALGSKQPVKRRSEADRQLVQTARLLAGRDDPLAAVGEFESQLAAASRGGAIFVPDLVTLAGAERAEKLLREALVRPVHLHFYDEYSDVLPLVGPTHRLAQRLAVELVGRTDYPQWELVDAYAPELFEAIDKRFPRATPHQGGLFRLLGGGGDGWVDEQNYQLMREEARAAYVIAMLLAGRDEDAIRSARLLVESDQHEMLSYHGDRYLLRNTGRDPQITESLTRLLREAPEVDLWRDLFKIARRAGRTQHVLAAAGEVAGGKKLEPGVRWRIRTYMVDALLADDRTDDAVAVMLQMLDEPRPAAPPPGAGIELQIEPLGISQMERSQLGLRLATLGRLLAKQEWIDRGLAEARLAVALDPATQVEQHYGLDYFAGEVANAFADAGRGAEGIAMLQEVYTGLHKAIEQQRKAAAGQDRIIDDSSSLRRLLLAMGSLYHRAGKHAEVIALFETADGWNAADVASFFEAQRKDDIPVGHMLASALFAAGRDADAGKLLDAMLDHHGDFDPAFELLVDQAMKDGGAGVAAAIAKLDALLARDRFEERPLIWRAELLRRHGKLEEAEKVVRQAIANPGDFWQRPPSMRACEVLAEIRLARGDEKEAAALRARGAASRIADEADRVYRAGLHRHAVSMYEKALAQSPDECRMHLRLAMAQADAGNWEKARGHYRRGFELLPQSVGRLDPRCFDAFEDARARAIADEVLTPLAEKEVASPQVHYLLGRLRVAQERQAEGVRLLMRAAELNPDYLAAHDTLMVLDNGDMLAPAERDAAVLAKLRLDPLSRHGMPDVAEMRDLTALWRAVEAAAKLRPPEPAELFSLPAAAEAKKRAAAGAVMMDEGRDWAPYFGVESPAKAVTGTRRVNLIRSLMRSDDQFGIGDW